MPNSITRQRLIAMFATFWMIATSIGILEFCIPTYHPVKAKSDRAAGAPHIHILKYVRVKFATSAEGWMMPSESSRIGT